MSILLDSWAWIEVFKGTEKGDKILEIITRAIKNGDKIYTTTGNLYEVYYRISQDSIPEST